MTRSLSAATALILVLSLTTAVQAQEKVTLRYGQIANSAHTLNKRALPG